MPAFVSRFHLIDQLQMRGIAEGVQPAKVLPFVHQRLMLVLAVDVHQAGGELLELVERHHDAVHAADGASGNGDLPRQDDLIFGVFKAVGVQERQRVRRVREGKGTLHISPVRTVADQLL